MKPLSSASRNPSPEKYDSVQELPAGTSTKAQHNKDATDRTDRWRTRIRREKKKRFSEGHAFRQTGFHSSGSPLNLCCVSVHRQFLMRFRHSCTLHPRPSATVPDDPSSSLVVLLFKQSSMSKKIGCSAWATYPPDSSSGGTGSPTCNT